MIEKIKQDAYLVVDDISFMSSLVVYDPTISNQTICFDQEPRSDIEETD
jgi:hypothetical protein